MVKLHVTENMAQLITSKGLTEKPLLLITDDGGGRYSLSGGACTIGGKFSIIVLNEPDARFDLPIENDAGWHLHSSAYDQAFMGPGLTLDVAHNQIQLRDDSGLLDSAVEIANGEAILSAFDQGTVAKGESC